MRFAFTLMVGLLVAALASPALAEPEEVMLRSGRSGMVEVTKTTPDSITIQFTKDGAAVTMKVKAKDLDPHSFYNVRRKHMEKVEKRLQDNSVIAQPLWRSVFAAGHKRVQNYKLHPTIYHQLNQVWLA